MNKENYLKFSIRYVLRDNEDNTQSLFVKTYQGSSLIADDFLGIIQDIVSKSKNKDDSVKALEEHIEKLSNEKVNFMRYIDDKIRITNDSTCDSDNLDDIKLFNTIKKLTLTIYKDLMKRINSNKYE